MLEEINIIEFSERFASGNDRRKYLSEDGAHKLIMLYLKAINIFYSCRKVMLNLSSTCGETPQVDKSSRFIKELIIR
ncbi:hypothetical protein [Mucilaginibacter sp. OK098]|uniref:hypothetical protein n=1 Tax=Mucilaginibacter sp. OK098 TaxID=1855297 RepID=UPI0009176FE5|nr:hypothetical protein [Mucilaginibacter sp. OK098]SHM81726.1 hypothetical protein SAMN05216524_103525 [Mucilaginibacter sp. OK098]